MYNVEMESMTKAAVDETRVNIEENKEPIIISKLAPTA